jgi:hypothetical protein
MRPIYRLGVGGKRFALLQIRGGAVRNNRWRKRAPIIAALALMAIALLFFFEWLGSEQPQIWVESPIAVPVAKDQAPKPRQ